jgi:hypothetical protein
MQTSPNSRKRSTRKLQPSRWDPDRSNYSYHPHVLLQLTFIVNPPRPSSKFCGHSLTPPDEAYGSTTYSTININARFIVTPFPTDFAKSLSKFKVPSLRREIVGMNAISAIVSASQSLFGPFSHGYNIYIICINADL